MVTRPSTSHASVSKAVSSGRAHPQFATPGQDEFFGLDFFWSWGVVPNDGTADWIRVPFFSNTTTASQQHYPLKLFHSMFGLPFTPPVSKDAPISLGATIAAAAHTPDQK